MNDYLGNELYVGDPVVFMILNYRGLTVGRIFKKAKIMVHVFPELIYLTKRLKTDVINLDMCNRQDSCQVLKITEKKYKDVLVRNNADYSHFFPTWNNIAEEESEFKKLG